MNRNRIERAKTNIETALDLLVLEYKENSEEDWGPLQHAIDHLSLAIKQAEHLEFA
jgi:hypothetical protein